MIPVSQIARRGAWAYAVDPAFGLYGEVHAATGARSSQIAALTVGDLQPDRVMMPGSRKGRGRKAGSRRPVPVTMGLAIKLRAAAGNRRPFEPLLLRPDGRPWRPSVGDHSRLFTEAAQRVGIECTIYALRHSSVVRSLLAGTPARVVAAMHDTSIPMLERTYSAFISDHSDEHARRGLLDIREVAS
jgi:integrase